MLEKEDEREELESDALALASKYYMGVRPSATMDASIRSLIFVPSQEEILDKLVDYKKKLLADQYL